MVKRHVFRWIGWWWALGSVFLTAIVGANADPHVFFPVPLSLEEPAAPWSPRLAQKSRWLRPKHLSLVNLSLWPAEPDSPRETDPHQFAVALQKLCRPNLPHNRAERYAKLLLNAAKQFEVDPFLLGALMYRQSQCLGRQKKKNSFGLFAIQPRMHRRFIQKRIYHYWTLNGGVWTPQELDLSKFPFTISSLRREEPNIYFAAAILSIYQKQCPSIDSRFGSVPHRHFVSHFIWGDQVKDASQEDWVLCARRRLLHYYQPTKLSPLAHFKSLKLTSPLDGVPRKITSGLGAIRAHGRRVHRGIDFDSEKGEPVRAVADGVVFCAGVDLPKRGRRGIRRLNSRRAKYFPRWRMGPGGLFVMIQHADDLMSAYMHLQKFLVKEGQEVHAGQVIGYVGRTGIRVDPPHLHFELRYHRRHINPAPILEPYIFMPEQIYRARFVMARDRKIRRRMWRRRLRRRKQRSLRKRLAARNKRRNAGKKKQVTQEKEVLTSGQTDLMSHRENLEFISK